jgi:hypothetical protein
MAMINSYNQSYRGTGRSKTVKTKSVEPGMEIVLSKQEIIYTDPIFIKGLVYKMTIEHTKSPGIKDYLAGWVKYDTCNNYGPGGRFMVEGDSNGWLKNHYTEFFLTPTQTEREQKLKEILYER